MSETESMKVTVRVPKGIMQFLNDIIPFTDYDSVDQYFEEAILSTVQSDIENNLFSPSIEKVTEKYNLDRILKPDLT